MVDRRLARLASVVALFLVGNLAIACKRTPPSGELLVFAAVSTAESLSEIAPDFQKQSGAPVRFSFGASRDLARQIRAGAPADVLVSADSETVDDLMRENLVRPDDRRRIVSNRLVIIVGIHENLDLRQPQDLVRAARIAIGDPAVVPAGRYAKKWLEATSLWADVKGRIVPTLDVRAALAAVESGRAQAGIVYRSDAVTSSRVRVAYEVPTDPTLEIEYVAARLAQAKAPSAALFVAFLTGPEARAAFARHGFVLYP